MGIITRHGETVSLMELVQALTDKPEVLLLDPREIPVLVRLVGELPSRTFAIDFEDVEISDGVFYLLVTER